MSRAATIAKMLCMQPSGGGNGTIDVKVSKSSVAKVVGGHLGISVGPRILKEIYRGECTNRIIPPHLIRATIIEELEYSSTRVWEFLDIKMRSPRASW